MCGIAGLINIKGRLDKETMRHLATQMAGTLAHRGPDDQGVWVSDDGFCALTQRRLAILDLTAAGHQPMIDAASGQALTFNGEIYNFKRLRTALEDKGARFHSHSDTEVLLQGLVLEGDSFIDKLDGMFAFAVYAPKTQKITLARDLFGEKPLYYTWTEDLFAFASELHALSFLPGFDNSITLDRIATYLALQYLPAPQTIYPAAFKLPPGHKITVGAAPQAQPAPFARFEARGPQQGERDLDDLADELEALLFASVKDRLVSDVSLGAFLSGGVDSSLVVALAQKSLRDENAPSLRTFSIGFEGSEESEHEQARAMAAHLGTNHTDRVLRLQALQTGRHIAKVLDEPLGDSSCLPVWILAELTRQHVTVALSGDGSDELFGGYTRYLRTLQDSAAGGADYNAGTNYYSPRCMILHDAAIEKFLGYIPAETAAVLAGLRAPLTLQTKPLLHRLRETDVQNYMPGAVLAKVDRMSMQHALEVRAPFLGREVADFAMRMAADDLCTTDQTKRLVKHLCARHVPRPWLDQPKKGFGLPTKGWGGGELTEELARLFQEPDCRLRQWISAERLERFIAFHRATPAVYQLWTVFILELWLRAHPHKAA